MKNVRIFLGGATLLLSFATAFAFKATPVVDDPARVKQGACTRVSATCNGVLNDCLETGTSNIVSQFQTGETCGAVLKMGNP
jgi:hypothetical protein